MTIQARESNHTPLSLRCAASISRSRPSARAAAAGSGRLSTSLVDAKPQTQSRAAPLRAEVDGFVDVSEGDVGEPRGL